MLTLATAIITCITISCAHSNSNTLLKNQADTLLTKINKIRAAQKIEPLIFSDTLAKSAKKQAKLTAIKQNDTKELPLDRITKTGSYARFALSCTIKGSSVDDAINRLIKDPLTAGKISHAGVTHMGAGIYNQGSSTYLTVDMARVVDPVDLTDLANGLFEDINKKRKLINITGLTPDAAMQHTAEQLVNNFIKAKASSDELIEKAKTDLAKNNFALGKITISFQVAGSKDELVIPERTSDPAARFIAIGIAQGNLPDHDAGSLAMAIFLATPQNSTSDANRTANLLKPRAMPGGHKDLSWKSAAEKAWIATLSGNHAKAAKLFKAAYKQTKNPQMIYEEARAYARNRQKDPALTTMKKYEELAKGDEKKKAAKMVKLLENGKSIFSTSKNEQINVEAKRFFILGQKLFESEQWQGAIDAFEQAYTYAPHPDLLYNIGLAHLKLSHIGDALDFFQQYMKLVPKAENLDQAKQLFQMGFELYSVGQFDAAATRFTMAYTLMPLPEVLFNLALCKKAMGDKKEALSILQELYDSAKNKKEQKEIQKMIRQIEK